MPTKPIIVSDANTAVQKFFLRELILFLLEKRATVIGDDDVVFTKDEFIVYLRRDELISAMGSINDSTIASNLKILATSFKARDTQLNIIPKDKVVDRVTYSRNKHKVIGSNSQYLDNLLRFIDISLQLGRRINDEEDTDSEVKSENEKSLFTTTKEHKLKFLNKETPNSLSTKERAIFLELNNNFRKSVRYDDLVEAINRANRAISSLRPNTRNTAASRRTLINNGITELRKRLFLLSGNPRAIITEGGRISSYKLVY